MWLIDAETPALAPEKSATETIKKAWTNVSAAPFFPGRSPPQAQGSKGFFKKSEGSAAMTSQAHSPGLAKGEGFKLSDKAAVFHPAAKSSTQHNSSDSPRVSAARVRYPVNTSTCWVVLLLCSLGRACRLKEQVLDMHIYLHQICTSCAHTEAASLA